MSRSIICFIETMKTLSQNYHQILLFTTPRTGIYHNISVLAEHNCLICQTENKNKSETTCFGSFGKQTTIMYAFFSIQETWNGELLLWYQEAYVMGNAFLENCIFYSPFMENLLKLHYHSEYYPIV